MLGQRGEGQPRVEQCGDRLAEPVAPVGGDGVHELVVGLDVAARLIPDGRLHRLDVRVLDHQQPVLPRIGERPQHRVTFAQEHPAARCQQSCHDLCPAPDAG